MPVYLGPLTTRAPLPTCTSVASSFPYFAQSGTGDAIIYSCYPPHYSIDGVYSPGICPSGWTSACTFTGGQSWVSTALATFETGVECCPYGFTCSQGVAWCNSATVRGKPILLVYQATDSAISRYFESGGTGEFTPDAGSTTTSTSVSTNTTSISVTNTTSLYITNTITVTTALPSQFSATAGEDRSALSTGAKAGIGISSAVAGIALIFVIVFFVTRRNRKLRTDQHGLGDSEGTARMETRAVGADSGSSMLRPSSMLHVSGIDNHDTDFAGPMPEPSMFSDRPQHMQEGDFYGSTLVHDSIQPVNQQPEGCYR